MQDEERTLFNSDRLFTTKQIGCLDFRSMVINLGIYTLVLMVTSGLFEGVYISSFFNAVNTALVMLVPKYSFKTDFNRHYFTVNDYDVWIILRCCEWFFIVDDRLFNGTII